MKWRERKLGYIPRRENTAISQMLDRGQRLEATIVELRAAQSPWQRIELEVTLLANA
ncbi:HIRAN domain-containing protein [Arhodomonas sp. SL1]|uniref:HIRAN domain-containing protein n=1 Tax=Arhodomonas sp. SL1 TaxID=3425691 RepID=UPI003F885996